MSLLTKAGHIAIAGKPNSGKSTLMNAIMGVKLSIVTAKPQTTRKKVLGIYSTDSLQIVFLDTPGAIEPKYELHRSMMRFVSESVNEADAVAVLVDLEDCKTPQTYFHSQFIELLKQSGKPLILVLNKIDTLPLKKDVLPVMAAFMKMNLFKEIIPLSALKNDNIAELVKVLENFIPESPFYYDPEMLSPLNERFFVSELIREYIFNAFRDEIPYSTEVSIVDYKEREAGKWFISAEIIVERQSQKQIIIGTQGSKIKEIGEHARMHIEEHLDMPVFLSLFVKVREKWRNNKTHLRNFGY